MIQQAGAGEHAHAVLAPSDIDAKMTARVIEFGDLSDIIAASVRPDRGAAPVSTFRIRIEQAHVGGGMLLVVGGKR